MAVPAPLRDNAAALKNPGLKAGEKVSINWQQKNGHKMADTVTITN